MCVQCIGADTKSTSGDYEYIEGCSVHRGFQYKSKAFINLLCHMNRDIPPIYSRYSPDVFVVQGGKVATEVHKEDDVLNRMPR